LPVFPEVSWVSFVRKITGDARFWQQFWHTFSSILMAMREEVTSRFFAPE
jgi:hypothetical protein